MSRKRQILVQQHPNFCTIYYVKVYLEQEYLADFLDITLIKC